MTSPATTTHGIDRSDIPTGNWVDRLLPPGLAPYARLARLDRPIGTWLLLFPCWWGASLAWLADPTRNAIPPIGLFVLFAIGALVMRGAGCTLNDIIDRDIDGRVARTALRPIPSGAISVRGAILFLLVQLALGAAVLFSLDPAAIWIGIGSLPLVALYPFMKRITYWPQIFLGLAFNWGALVGYAAQSGRLDLPAVILYAAGIVWTLGYDTIYAHQDKEDDVFVGVKSTALLFGDDTRPWLAGFYTATILLIGVTGAMIEAGPLFYLFLAAAAAQLGWQMLTVRLDAPTDCLAKFKSNRLCGWLIFVGMLLDGFV